LIGALAAGVLIGKGTVEPGGGKTTEPTPTVEATGSAEPTAALPADDGSADSAVDVTQPQFVKVFFARGDKLGVSLRQIPPTKAVATAAMQALLLGPTGEEDEFGLHSEIPVGTKLRSVSIKSGVATVDLSNGFDDGGGTLSVTMRLAQVVHTLTQFKTVTSVVFKMDGTLVSIFTGEGFILDDPQKRSDYEDVSPAILVESPTPAVTVKSPLRISGTANTFEATFVINITDPDGLIIAEKVVTATSGSGTRGTFDVSVPFETSRTGLGALIVFERSAMDGSQINVVEIPLKMTP
jgi:hypothetical protein